MPNSLHKLCWRSLKENLLLVQNKSLIVGGDLKLVLNADEKSRDFSCGDPYLDSLENIIECHNLMNIHPKNGIYSWKNKRIGKGNIKECLDKILIQDSII